ncbi:MAG: TonB-dependent receptor [Muribaculaceae bacterium]|nr:TonB-dependent receptor [Muribaculaceae bacterium]
MILICCAVAPTIAQQITVKGTVVDDTDDPLPGVSVVIKGHKTGVMTDINGNYVVNAKPNDVIEFTYIGMKPESVKVNGRTKIDVTLVPDSNVLDEFVAVGYGVQKRGTITGAVSTVQGAELLKVPVMPISSIIGSRVAGVATLQTSGEPGADGAQMRVRGQGNVVYVIDGIRRQADDFNQLDPHAIESISILKDAASVAIYGLDADGVIIVTTKLGANEKTKISYTGTIGISQNAENQQWLDGPGYAYWFNKGLEMDGLSPIFTPEHVEKMRLGIDGWGNTNWYKEIFGTGYRTDHNVQVSGGNDRVRFFTSLGYLKEDGNVDNFGFDRWTIRSNVEATIANGLKFTAGLSGRLQNRDNPYFSADPDAYGNIGAQMVRMLPYLPKTIEENGEEYYVGNISNGMNMSALASIHNNGYTKRSQTSVATNMALQWDTPFLPGLSLKFTASYDANFYFTKQLNNPCPIKLYKRAASEFVAPDVLEYMDYRNFNNNYIALTEGGSRNHYFTTISSITYNNKFGVHNINAIGLVETREFATNSIGAYGRGLDFITLDELSAVSNKRFDGSDFPPSVSGSSSMARYAGMAGRVNYNYDDRFFGEVSTRYDGSYLFGGMNKRWVALPGVSAGWRIDRENFFNVDWINYLKIRGGFGQTGTSEVAPFIYRNTMVSASNGVVFDGQSTGYVSAYTLGNPTLTWSLQDNYNLGFDTYLFNSTLSLEFDAFYKYKHHMLTGNTGAYPPSIGGYHYASANLNKQDIKGFDLTLSYNNRIQNFIFGAKLIWSYAYARWLYCAGDSDNAPEYQRLTGKQVGSKLGFLADGLWQTEEEIAQGPIPQHSPKGVLPGQIRYIDRNGDGKITYADDMGYVGRSAIPTHTGSLDLNGSWNGFDFDILFGWGLGHDIAMTGVYTATGSEGIMDGSSYTVPFKWYGNSPTYLVENSWTPENTNAEFPRLCAVPQNNNDAYASTFWYRSGNYMRIKSAQIGYTLPYNIVKKAGISNLRFFVEGYNLVTWSSLKKFNIDPEAPAVNNGYYPQQRKVSFGLNLSF